MKLYLSAAFRRQKEMYQIGKKLRTEGFELTSRWLLEKPIDPPSVNNFRVRGEIDRADVRRADMVIRFSDNLRAKMIPSGLATGARHTEVGMALAWGIPVVVVAGRQNIFDYLPEIKHVKDFSRLLKYLKKERKRCQAN